MTNKTRPLIVDIKGNSLDDGPGIRSVVFFKGCPLSCAWCQNPESKQAAAELSWDRERCIGCGTCISTCLQGAVSADNPFFVDRNSCTFCFECVEPCPSQALTRVGLEMNMGEIAAKVLRYKPFFETSGGGVTLSGGEPTLNMGFASTLLKYLKDQGIHTILETCGWFDIAEFEKLMLPYIDAIYMDIKVMDPAEHRLYCGVSNELILRNLVHLHERSKSGAFTLLPRTPLIPGFTDSEEQINRLASFYKEQHLSNAVLLPNNPVWFDKCAKLGKKDPFDRSGPLGMFYDEEKKTRIKEQFSQYEIAVIFG